MRIIKWCKRKNTYWAMFCWFGWLGDMEMAEYNMALLVGQAPEGKGQESITT